MVGRRGFDGTAGAGGYKALDHPLGPAGEGRQGRVLAVGHPQRAIAVGRSAGEGFEVQRLAHDGGEVVHGSHRPAPDGLVAATVAVEVDEPIVEGRMGDLTGAAVQRRDEAQAAEPEAVPVVVAVAADQQDVGVGGRRGGIREERGQRAGQGHAAAVGVLDVGNGDRRHSPALRTPVLDVVVERMGFRFTRRQKGGVRDDKQVGIAGKQGSRRSGADDGGRQHGVLDGDPVFGVLSGPLDGGHAGAPSAGRRLPAAALLGSKGDRQPRQAAVRLVRVGYYPAGGEAVGGQL
ncbi:MAG: hypothetical protein M5U09_05780 [Gammaproteobacteria bacterium]|nr:hypothetical protein [Gammaproteobacteria bacterium]